MAVIEHEAARHDAHLICNPSNVGLAAALNQGARWAFAEGHAFVLALDQDSEPLAGITEELLRVFHLANAQSKTALVGSNFLDDRTKDVGFPFFEDAPQRWTKRRTVITSGSLIERSAFEEVGPFREDFFVDSVDDEYCLRARASGFQVVLATRPLMRHSIGTPTVHRLAGLRITTTNHSAARRYDIVRNRLVLCKEYAFREPRWAVASLFALLKETIWILLFERDRPAKARSIAAGGLHGLLGTGGRSGSGHLDR